MHLFSTRSWHIVHWDPVITIVFPEFLSTSIYRCGTVGFGVLIFHFGFSLSLFCNITTLVFFIISLITVVSVDPTSAKLYLLTVVLWAVILCWLAKSLWAPVLFMQDKTPRVEYSTGAQRGIDGVKSQSWTQVRAIYILTTLSSVFFSHGPMPDHKASVAPVPTRSGSLSCKSLLASHCAVFQSTVSSDDCAINTSMNGCYPYVASIYVRLSNVTIHPYLHCGGNWFLLLFIAVIKHHP